MSERFFDAVNLAQSDEEVTAALENGLELLNAALVEVGEDHVIPLPEEDLSLVRTCARNGGPKTRAWAVDFLCEWEECSWQDLESWILDPEEVVRAAVLSSIARGYSCAGRVFATDRERCLNLLTESLQRYPDSYGPALAMEDLSTEDDEWLDLTWVAADKIVSLGDPELVEMIYCSYYEDVIPEHNWGPDDPHIRRWIETEDKVRCRILLNIATYGFGMEKGRMREIATALAQVKDPAIARIAKGVLDGSVRHGEF